MEQNRNEIISNEFSGLTLSEIVTQNFKAAAVFEKYNLDFCCGGKKPVSEAWSFSRTMHRNRLK